MDKSERTHCSKRAVIGEVMGKVIFEVSMSQVYHSSATASKVPATVATWKVDDLERVV